jgi:hypothetical protein
MTRSNFRVRELFTLWYSFKWSATLVAVMLLVSLSDVALTLLNVGKYGIKGEINPVANFMIGAGQPLTLLWAVLDILSTFLICVPLISLCLILPPDRREGNASTLISAVLAIRITVVLYSFTILWYRALDALSAVIAVGLALIFPIRFVLRHGDDLSLATLRFALSSLWTSIKSFFAGLPAVPVHPSIMSRDRKRRRTDERLVTISGGVTRRRSVKRIAFLLASLFVIPVGVFTVLQIMMDLTGITGLTRTLLTMPEASPESQAEGLLFVTGLVLAIAAVIAMMYVILALIDELSKR